MIGAVLVAGSLLCPMPAPLALPAAPTMVEHGIEHLIDAGDDLGRNDVLSPEHCHAFEPISGVPRFGSTQAGVWLRFRAAFAGPPEQWRMSVNYAPLSHLCVHWPISGGAYRSICGGLHAIGGNSPAWSGAGFRFAVPASFDDSRPILINASSRSWLKVPIEFGRVDALMARHQKRELVWGLYFGILITLVLYGAVVAWDSRSRLYGFYAAHFATLALGLAAWQGRLLQFGLPEWSATVVPGLSLGLWVAFGTHFYQRLLSTTDSYPNTDLVLRATRWVAGAGSLASIWDPVIGLMIVALAGLLFVPATLHAGIRRAMQGFQPAIYVIVAMGPLLLAALLKAGEPFGIVLFDPDLITAVIRISAVAGAGVLVFALGQGGRLREREREQQAELNLTDHRMSLLRARFDSTTGLASRDKHLDDLRERLHASSAATDPLAVITVSLDKFRSINHALGFSVGDAVLREIADRLRKRLRSGDLLGRIGPDIFGVVTPVSGEHEATLSRLVDLCADLQEAVGEPLRFGEGARLGASMGVALYPDHGVTADSLIRHSDAAMYRAKEIGGGAFELFKPEMMRDADRHLKLSRMLRLALERDEFELHYQPIVSLETGEISGLEALLRWTTADGQSIPPDLFIPVAESSDLIVSISEWVLNAACKQIADWRARGIDDGRHVAVNLSPRQFRDPGLVSVITRALRTHQVPRGALSVELTEGVVIDDLERSRSVLEQLRRYDIGVAIDDFGVGFSSLSYLRNLPVTCLKIDRSFLRGTPDETEASTVISTMVRLGRDLNLQVIAEGIETPDQRDFLADNRCSDGQGFLFCRALPARELEMWFENRSVSLAVA